MADRQLQGDAAAHAVADDVGVPDLQMTTERRRVVGHLLIRERTVDVGGAPMPLEIRGDDLVALTQRRQDRAEHLA